MDFELSADEKLLVETVQSFTKKDSPVERFRRLRGTELGWERATWKQMGELGWLGVSFPESAGGAGLGFVAAGLVLEQLGATLVPEPFLSSVVLAGTPLAAAGTPEQHERFLAPLIAGDTALALAHVEAQSRHDSASVSTRATRAGAAWRLTGRKRWVLDGHGADHLLVSARTGGSERERDGVSLFVVDAAQPGVRLERVDCMDGHKAALVELDGVEVDATRLVGPEGGGAAILDLALDHAAAGACAEGAGLLARALDMTREYLMQRKQFGAAIGSFQALQHRAVDMFVEVELCKSAALLAMIKVSDPSGAERMRAVSAAKAQLARGGAFVVRQATQLHGGIGVTDEHDIGLYFKRHQALAALFGDFEHHVARYASLPSFDAHV